MNRRDLLKGVLGLVGFAVAPKPLLATPAIAAPIVTPVYNAVSYGLSIDIPFKVWHNDTYKNIYDLIDAAKVTADARMARVLEAGSIWSMTPEQLAAVYPTLPDSFDEDDD